MKKELAAIALALTQELLEAYWQKDYAPLADYFAPEGTWIGAQQEQFYQGKDEITRALQRVVAEMQPCYLLHQEYRIVCQDKNSCTVMGRYLATTDETAPYFLQAWQRVTVVWTLEKDGLKIRHYHVSNPIGELRVGKGESFVNTVGKMTYRFLQIREQAQQSKRRVILTDSQENIHFISAYEIEYAAADRRNTSVFLADGQEISARIKLTDLQQQTAGILLPVHRSYLVNPFYINHLKKQTAVLRSGACLPIPEKKYGKVREQLDEFFAQQMEGNGEEKT